MLRSSSVETEGPMLAGETTETESTVCGVIDDGLLRFCGRLPVPG
jgi:hypothetical protein